MSEYDENKESSNLNYWDINNLYGWAMSQKFPTFGLDWGKKTLQNILKISLKTIMKKVK